MAKRKRKDIGEVATWNPTPKTKQTKSVKRQIADLVETAIDRGHDAETVANMLGCDFCEGVHELKDVIREALKEYTEHQIGTELYAASLIPLRVLTYAPKAGGDADFVEPRVPVLLRHVDGIRVVLGSHDFGADKPDVLIERRKNGWVVFLHPIGHTDPCGYFYIHDDGRSWFQHENPFGGPPQTEILSHRDKSPKEIDE